MTVRVCQSADEVDRKLEDQNVLDLRLSYVSAKALHGSIGKQWCEWMPLRKMKRFADGLDKRPRPCHLQKKKEKVESHGRASKKSGPPRPFATRQQQPTRTNVEHDNNLSICILGEQIILSILWQNNVM